MIKYEVRSTITKRESAARKAADIIVMLLICVVLLFILFWVMWRPVQIKGVSITGLNDGELVIVDRVSKYLWSYDRGDILRADTGMGYNEYRVVAMGGETLLVTDGKSYINNAYLDEGAYNAVWESDVYLSITVPNDSLLLLPDNRVGILTESDLNSYIVKKGAVYGELRFRIYPISAITLFD